MYAKYDINNNNNESLHVNLYEIWVIQIIRTFFFFCLFVSTRIINIVACNSQFYDRKSKFYALMANNILILYLFSFWNYVCVTSKCAMQFELNEYDYLHDLYICIRIYNRWIDPIQNGKN